MSYTCFHCEHQTESAHSITLYQSESEHIELLCDDCYQEWLLSSRG